MTGFSLILAVALAAAFVLLVVLLLAAILYYRWRLRKSNHTLARFIKENIELRSENKSG